MIQSRVFSYASFRRREVEEEKSCLYCTYAEAGPRFNDLVSSSGGALESIECRAVPVGHPSGFIVLLLFPGELLTWDSIIPQKD
jgi:hypothetical protein